MSRKLTERLQELERENTSLKEALLAHDHAAHGFMAEVERAADDAVLNMKHDLELALGHLSQHQPYAEDVYNEIADERTRQDMKHGIQNDLTNEQCFIFTMEEVGEVAHVMGDILVASQNPAPDGPSAKAWDATLYTEIIQAAACFVKWAQIIKLRGREVRDILEIVREGKPNEE